MQNKKILVSASVTAVLIISNVLLAFQILSLKKFLASSFETISYDIGCLFQRQEKNMQEIKDGLLEIKNKSDSQFSKTVSLSQTYAALLEEQKKKTIDTAEGERTFLESKRNALNLYKRGFYSDAYKEYKKLSEIQKDDMECLLYKVKSLFYINMAESSQYRTILDDIKILKLNGASDDECYEIEKTILAEIEGIDE